MTISPPLEKLRLEVSIQRQVLIQARILEVTLRKEFETGVRWDNIQTELLNLDLSQLSLSWNIFGGGTPTSATGALLVAGATGPLANGDFVLSDLVKALETQGK
ncbi:MAG: hypothetical protein P8017_18035, partial [Deltaproteobacteria bacterium]